MTTEVMTLETAERADIALVQRFFDDADAVTRILAELTQSAKSAAEEHDASTEKGRKAIASVAHRIARVKIKFDNAGKELVSGWKKQAKAVDAERKRIRDACDSLKDEVRLPVTQYEQAEAERKRKILARLERIKAVGETEYASPADLVPVLEKLKAVKPDVGFDEYGDEAARIVLAATQSLQSQWRTLAARAAEQAELESLRQEKAAREAAEREERRKWGAAAKARREAEERIEREAAEKAEVERVRREDKEAAMTTKMMTLETNRNRVFGRIVCALYTQTRLPSESCDAVARVIADGKIPHVRVEW